MDWIELIVELALVPVLPMVFVVEGGRILDFKIVWIGLVRKNILHGIRYVCVVPLRIVPPPFIILLRLLQLLRIYHICHSLNDLLD